MAPKVLGLGIPASSPLVPEQARQVVDKGIKQIQADMEASPYYWEFFDWTPDVGWDTLIHKLKEQKWDVVMVGMGLRASPTLTPFFQETINTTLKELPNVRFAFNGDWNDVPEACRRALEGGK